MIKVYRVTTNSVITAVDVIPLMEEHKIEFHALTYHNWESEYPYKPQVEFRMAHTGNNLLIHYKVREEYVRAVAEIDGGRVWEDACCEFFISPDQNEFYYNFECNCAGTLLLNYGVVGNRKSATQEVMAKIDRWSSLGRHPFDVKEAQKQWELTLVIPINVLFEHGMNSWAGKRMKANVYKCGDLLPKPHFVSLTKIDLPTPCFHCPQYFTEFEFE